MVPFELVIFDCDGVVVDSEVLACRALADVMAAHGIPIAIEEVFERFLGRTSGALDDYWREQRGGPLPGSFRPALAARLEELYRSDLRVMPHMLDVLDRIDRPYCLASSSDPERIRMTLEVTRLGHYFRDRVYNAAMVKRGKPAPDLFLHVAGEMGARPGATLVVEDSLTGISAGKAAGMTVWAFTGGSHYSGRDMGAALAAAGADRVFISMSDFLER
jgi:HAD superfamily hydrolase (TIGR01509 family)